MTEHDHPESATYLWQEALLDQSHCCVTTARSNERRVYQFSSELCKYALYTYSQSSPGTINAPLLLKASLIETHSVIIDSNVC